MNSALIKTFSLNIAAIIFVGLFSVATFATISIPVVANACVGAGAAAQSTVAGQSLSTIASVPVSNLPIQTAASIQAGSAADLQEKNCAENGIAWVAAKVAVRNLTQSIVSWINSGFQGSPAFVGNPSGYFTDVADQIAGNFIAGSELGFMCEPFQANIRLALNLNFNAKFTQTNYCRLSDVAKNSENFAKFTSGGDFNQGGWDTFWDISQNPANSPLGAYIEADNELGIRTARSQQLALAQLNWGQGFLSYRPCEASDSTTHECIKYGAVQTPGSVIESQLNQALPVGMQELVQADEFNEIVGALMGQLVNNVLSGGLSNIGKGGLNTTSPGNNTTPQLTVWCAPNKTTAKVGDFVEWSAYAQDGSGHRITFDWSSSDPIVEQVSPNSDTSSISDMTAIYENQGVKTASVRATQDGRSIFQRCAVSVNVSE